MEKIDGLIVIKEYYKDEVDESGNVSKIKVVVCRENTYTESKKESNKRYVNNNREKVSNYLSGYIKNRYQNDPEFKEKIKEQKRQSYYKMKEKKKMEKEEVEKKEKITTKEDESSLSKKTNK